MSVKLRNEAKKAATSPTEEELETSSNATIMMALANLTALVTGIQAAQADASKRLDSVLIKQEDGFKQFGGQVSKAVEEQIETAALVMSRNLEQKFAMELENMGGKIFSFQDRLDSLEKSQEGKIAELTLDWQQQMINEMKALSNTVMSMQEKIHTLETMGFDLSQREPTLSAPTSATRAFNAPRHLGATPRHERFMFDDEDSRG